MSNINFFRVLQSGGVGGVPEEQLSFTYTTCLWTEVDGVAVYDGNIEVNGVNVGKGSGTGNNHVAVGEHT